MSCNCQFCDKEFMFEAQATHELGYITCGQTPCIMQAKATAKGLHAQETRRDELVNANVLIFSTKTPEDVDTWRILAEADHPEFIKDPAVMAQMVLGYITNMQTGDDETDVTFYCAKSAKNVHKDVNTFAKSN